MQIKNDKFCNLICWIIVNYFGVLNLYSQCTHDWSIVDFGLSKLLTIAPQSLTKESIEHGTTMIAESRWHKSCNPKSMRHIHLETFPQVLVNRRKREEKKNWIYYWNIKKYQSCTINAFVKCLIFFFFWSLLWINLFCN